MNALTPHSSSGNKTLSRRHEYIFILDGVGGSVELYVYRVHYLQIYAYSDNILILVLHVN